MHDQALIAAIAGQSCTGADADDVIAFSRDLALRLLYQYPIIIQERDAYIRAMTLPPVVQ